MKKKGMLIIAFILIIIIGGTIVYFCLNQKSKFYLTEKYYTEEGKFIEVTKEELEAIKEENYILYTYNNFCRFPIPCDSIFEEFMETYHISFLSLPFTEFKSTSFYPTVKYAPSIIIIKNKKVIAYLDADSDEDMDKYQDVEKLKEWLEEYVYLSK